MLNLQGWRGVWHSWRCQQPTWHHFYCLAYIPEYTGQWQGIRTHTHTHPSINKALLLLPCIPDCHLYGCIMVFSLMQCITSPQGGKIYLKAGELYFFFFCNIKDLFFFVFIIILYYILDLQNDTVRTKKHFLFPFSPNPHTQTPSLISFISFLCSHSGFVYDVTQWHDRQKLQLVWMKESLPKLFPVKLFSMCSEKGHLTELWRLVRVCVFVY